MDNIVFGFAPHQTAMLIAKAQDSARDLGYSPGDILSAAVVCGITYNGRRDMSVLDQSPLPREDLVNCAPVLDDDFFQEAEKMRKNPEYRQEWVEKYHKEILPKVESV